MLPYYNPNRKPLTRWERFTGWLEDITPYIVIFGIIAATCLFFIWLMPKCPECDAYIHPMDTYCSKCGHQLRTTKSVRLSEPKPTAKDRKSD